MRLVLRIDRVAERTRQRFVERDQRHASAARARESRSRKRVKPCTALTGAPSASVNRRRHRMPGAEDVEAGVDQMRGRRHRWATPFADDGRERGTRALGRGFARGADVHEADDALVFGKPEQRRRIAIVGGPAGQPLRAETERLRAEQQVVGDAAGATGSVPAPAPSDDPASMRAITATISGAKLKRSRSLSITDGGASGSLRRWISASALAEPRARIAADQQQAPRRQLAVIGHADRRGQQLFELRRRRAGFAELARRHRAALVEKIEGHDVDRWRLRREFTSASCARSPRGQQTPAYRFARFR